MQGWKDRYRTLGKYAVNRGGRDGVLWDGPVIHEKAEPGPDGTTVRRIIMTTSHYDRANDAIEAAGISFKNYRANPVILWAHDHYSPAIGKSMAEEPVTLPDGVTGVRFVYNLHRATPLSADVDTLVGLGVINTGSISVIPLTWSDTIITEEEIAAGAVYPSWSDRKRLYITSECLEGTLCNVPMNPHALMQQSYDPEFTRRVQDAVVRGLLASDSPALAGLDRNTIVIPGNGRDAGAPYNAGRTSSGPGPETGTTGNGEGVAGNPDAPTVDRAGKKHSAETLAALAEIFDPIHAASTKARAWMKAAEEAVTEETPADTSTAVVMESGEAAAPRVTFTREYIDQQITQMFNTHTQEG